ncbi:MULTISPECIES: hypothetical protein [Pseudomonas]|nr:MULTISPECIES: hypothetical protein [Pseudomonas]MDG9809471.1 hypothetical protein [Pseudomonas juntendi]MDG9815828.1 hypothetical protein [Pseudomonas putida]
MIELLNEQGVTITWEQFRSAYDARRKEREERGTVPKTANPMPQQTQRQ